MQILKDARTRNNLKKNQVNIFKNDENIHLSGANFKIPEKSRAKVKKINCLDKEKKLQAYIFTVKYKCSDLSQFYSRYDQNRLISVKKYF